MARKTSVERTKQAAAPTQAEYSGFQRAFDFFNAELFDGRLPNYLITLQRHANTRGYFAADKFSGRIAETTLHELALNPDHFTGRTDEQILSTLVHEMMHGWQLTFGQSSRRGYHNREWAAAMKQVGLYPSSTGAVGGKETGQRVSHYVIPGGPFQSAYAKLDATGFKLNWQSSVRATQGKTVNSKTKFTCPDCHQNAWGKPDLDISCNVCGQVMMPVDSTKQDEADDA